ncbi:DGKG [Bugula neritina]|uniref:DGKG n=1 Tax=Bugula neritina TaxID=10212 RepID=A0A7J7JZE6_BUGNE|nr:DGKG [Bugula neritina]
MCADVDHHQPLYRLTPSEFYTLQEYVSYTGHKLADVLAEFERTGNMSRYNHEQPIDYEGFKAFMQSYFDTDFPEELCQGLFLTFIKPDGAAYLKQQHLQQIQKAVLQVGRTLKVALEDIPIHLLNVKN